MDTENLFQSIYSMGLRGARGRFEYLGEGIARAVYAVGDRFAVKIAKNLDGDDQCELENRIYKHAGHNIRKYLCPVIWYKPGMVVMPRAVPLSSIIHRKYIDITKLGWGNACLRDMLNLSKKYDLLFEDLVSVSSWGLISGITVLIDYGCIN